MYSVLTRTTVHLMRFNRVNPRNQPDTIDISAADSNSFLQNLMRVIDSCRGPSYALLHMNARHEWHSRCTLLRYRASFWSENRVMTVPLLWRIREISFNVANSSGDLTRAIGWKIWAIDQCGSIWIEIKYALSRDEIIEWKQFWRKWFYNGETIYELYKWNK